MRGLISTFPPREISQAMQNKLTFSFPQFAISREWNWNCTRLLVVFSGMHSGSQNLIYCVCCWEWARKSYPSAKIRISISLVLKFVVKRGSWVRGAYTCVIPPLVSARVEDANRSRNAIEFSWRNLDGYENGADATRNANFESRGAREQRAHTATCYFCNIETAS